MGYKCHKHIILATLAMLLACNQGHGSVIEKETKPWRIDGHNHCKELAITNKEKVFEKATYLNVHYQQSYPCFIRLKNGSIKSTATDIIYATNPDNDIITHLTETSAMPTKSGEIRLTPLHLMAMIGSNPETIEILINHGIPIDISNGQGITPLGLAAFYNTPSMLTVLLNKGANAKHEDTSKANLLHHAAFNEEYPENITILIGKGANVNGARNDNQTPLHIASRYNNNPESVKALLKGGAEIHKKNAAGETALLLAARHNSNPEVIAVLLEQNATIEDTTPNGETSLHRASGHNKESRNVRILLEAGINVNAQDNKQNTPLHSNARTSRNGEITRILLEKGADISLSNENGETPLHTALKHGSSSQVLAQILTAEDKPITKETIKQANQTQRRNLNHWAIIEPLR